MNFYQQVASNLKEQIRTLWKPVLLYFYLPSALVLLLAILAIVETPSMKPELLFRDITTLANLPFYTGFVSQIGVLLWAASATSCFIALYFLKNMNALTPQAGRFLLHAGLLSAFLMLDDMFLLHEDVAAIYLSIGQKRVYFAYFLVILAFLYFNRREILSSSYLVLIVAMAILGVSMSMDVVTDTFHDALAVAGSFYERYEVIFEDGLKLLGIATWLAYYLIYIQAQFAPVIKRLQDVSNSE